MNSIAMVLALVMEVVVVAKNMLNYANSDWVDNFPVICRYHCDNVNRALVEVDTVHVRIGSDLCRYFSMCNWNRSRRIRPLRQRCMVLVVVVD